MAAGALRRVTGPSVGSGNHLQGRYWCLSSLPLLTMVQRIAEQAAGEHTHEEPIGGTS
jgi:hypothetical protein